MMKLDQLRTMIKKQHEIASFAVIGKQLGLTAPTVRRIMLGHKISDATYARLNLEPPDRITELRKRRTDLNRISQEWGYLNWHNYETEMIKSRKESQSEKDG